MVLRRSLLAFLSVVLTVSVSAGGRRESLVGTVMDPPKPAVDFALTDQRGQSFRMSDTHGKVVVVTFLYTHCTDVCPLLAIKMKRAREILGSEAAQAVFLAITTDPARDTPEVAAAYSRELGLYDGWSFVTGSPEALQAVWAAYAVDVQSEEGEAQSHGHAVGAPEAGLSDSDLSLASSLIRAFGGGYDVAHSTPFWVVDREGRMRVLLSSDASPQDIARDVRSLLRE